jgi:lipopolysaccharide/colanic/teichoic acid biosynthesis glycosyltransferase
MRSFYLEIVKPLADFAGASLLLIVLSPLMLLIACLLLIFNNGKVFFLQKRIGYRERLFTIFKFRTLKDYTDELGNSLPDADRMFPLGTFLRLSHLDELPQLVNVLAGELSFIGPRPLPPQYLNYYSIEERKRHLCKPGIAGLSQILAGNAKPWGERLRYDIFYYRHRSFLLDCLIIYRLFTRYIFHREKSDLFCESFIDFSIRRSIG